MDSKPWEQGPWPRDARGVWQPIQLALRAERPRELEQLTRWGIAWRPLVADDGAIVAAVIAHGDLARIWADLARCFAETGLWPVVSDDEMLQERAGGAESVSPDAQRFLLGLRDEALAYVDPESDIDSGRLQAFAGVGPAVQGVRAYGPPALAPGQLLLVVPAASPAHVPAALGWLGPVNVDLAGGDLAGVLQSWQERFGALLMGLGGDTLDLQVPCPPTLASDAWDVAVEHYLVCPDNIEQGSGTLEAYLPQVLSGRWSFWWD